MVIAATLALSSTGLPLDLDRQTKSDPSCRLHAGSFDSKAERSCGANRRENARKNNSLLVKPLRPSKSAFVEKQGRNGRPSKKVEDQFFEGGHAAMTLSRQRADSYLRSVGRRSTCRLGR